MATEYANLSQPPTSISPSFSHIVTIKLNSDNYLLWQVQIFAYFRGQDLYFYIDGTNYAPPTSLSTSSTDSNPKPNPTYQTWKRINQVILSILFSSLLEYVIGHVISPTTSRDLWKTLESVFSSYSQAKEF